MKLFLEFVALEFPEGLTAIEFRGVAFECDDARGKRRCYARAANVDPTAILARILGNVRRETGLCRYVAIGAVGAIGIVLPRGFRNAGLPTTEGLEQPALASFQTVSEYFEPLRTSWVPPTPMTVWRSDGAPMVL